MKNIIRFNTQCITCLFEKAINNIPENTSETEKLNFAKAVMKIMADAKNSESAPELLARITDLQNDYFGERDNYAKLKEYFNSLMLGISDELEQRIINSSDSLYTALCFSLLGNYIDFGALNKVDEKYLKESFDNISESLINRDEYGNFKNELENAKNLVFITDNCGEIVVDMLLIKELKRKYPMINVNVIVRGAPVINDATIKDAKQVGLTDIVSVTPNGTNIAGTVLGKISDEAQNIIDSGDIIVAKGQGNFETLSFCGKNIYYLFLCKCKLFADRFGVSRCTGMFLNDLRMEK